MKMNENNIVFLLLMICCWCWMSKSSVILTKKQSQSISTDDGKTDSMKNRKSVIDCNQYRSDQDIINQIPFNISSDWNTEESIYSMDETNTLVTYLLLKETGAIVPEIIFCLRNLETLIIADMNFLDGTISDTLGNLEQLVVLTIYNTPITHMPAQLASLINLRSLDLQYCSLFKLPNLSKLPYLYEFRVSHNYLTEIDGLNSISRLLLDNNLLTEIPSMIDADGPMHLSISSNPLNNLIKLSSFINLYDVDLSSTTISSIPPSIGKLQNLSELDLSNNKLSSLPSDIYNLPYLNVLSINDNLFPAEEIERLQVKFTELLPYMTLNV